MELRSENVEVQMNASGFQNVNHRAFVVNEDVAVTSEMAIERSNVVEIEKTVVIQKKFIVNEKIIIPKQTATYSQNPLLLGCQAVCIDARTSLMCCDVSFPDSQGSGKMEIASQESLDSRMDFSSQGSHLSLMEYSSQEADIPITPVNEGSIPEQEITTIVGISDAKSGKEIGTPVHPEDVLPTEDYSNEVPSNENPPFLQEAIPEPDDVLNFKVDFPKTNVQEDEIDETVVGNEASIFKHPGSAMSDDMYFERRLSTQRSLLSREEAIAAREAACMSREKAIKEREVALGSEGRNLQETAENDLPSPKRLKLISVFEYV